VIRYTLDHWHVLTATSPTGSASAWTKTDIDGSTAIDSIRCASTTQCVADDNDGNVLTSTNPTGGSGAWTTSDIDGSTSMGAVSCPSTSLCIVGDDGNVFTATSPPAAQDRGQR